MSSADVTAPISDSHRSGDALLHDGIVFGRFLILNQVGDGGVGQVFAAYDPDLDRRVALKVLRPTGAGTPDSGSEAGRGLLSEAKALAQLTHPHVVTVYEVGEADAMAYIAMELVEGQDLGAWFASRDRPDWREGLRLMVQAGEGLAAAHARDTIHRDFKPANVLVGADGRVRVGDFGLARSGVGASQLSLDAPIDDSHPHAMQTRVGRLIGTPYYMAPELFDGVPHGVASDVYAFCVTLYEAVVGRRPFAATSVLELQALKTKGLEFARSDGDVPVRVRKAISRGLDPEPSARWASMDELLTVLRTAAEPGRGRARWVLAGGGVLLGVAAISTSTQDAPDPCLGGEERRDEVWSAERRDAIATALEANPATQTSSEDVLVALDGFSEAWAAEYRVACESARRGERSGEALDAAMACLDRNMVEFDTFVGLLVQGGGDGVLAASSGVADLSTPVSCARPGRVDGPKPPPKPIAEAVAAVDAEVARVRANVVAGAYAEAMTLAEDAYRRASELDDGPVRARATYWLARATSEVRTSTEAAALYEQALWQGHRSAELEVPARAALRLVGLFTTPLDRPKDAARFFAYAEAEIERRDLGALLPELERARANLERMDRDDAGVVAAHERAQALLADAGALRRAEYLSAYASDLGRLGRVAEAADLLQRALELASSEVGDAHPVYARILGELGLAKRLLGDVDLAREYSTRALEIQIAARGPVHAAVAFERRRLASLYWRTEAMPEAIAEYTRVVEIDEALYEPPNGELAADYTELASVYAAAMRPTEAAPYFAKAIAAFGPDSPADSVADTRCKYGALLHILERSDEAATEVDAGLALLKGTTSAAAGDAVRMCARTRSMIAATQGDPVLAVEMADRALSKAEEMSNPQHPGLVRDIMFAAAARRTAGELDRAAALLERAVALTSPGHQPTLSALAEVQLGEVRLAQGDRDGARALAEAALERVREDGPGGRDIRKDAQDLLRAAR